MMIFLDTETGGLDPQRHPLIEVAWALDNGPIECIVLPHDIYACDPDALRINGYHARNLGDPEKWATSADVTHLWDALAGATICAANPAFDASFLSAGWRVWTGGTEQPPWHYRMLDIESFAAAHMGLPAFSSPPGLNKIAAWLAEAGAEIPTPDHTAAGDVATLRTCYLALAG